MTTSDICHFCNRDYTDDPETYLLVGPANEINICENCVIDAATLIINQTEFAHTYRRCDVCGESKESIYFGVAPIICGDCLLTTIRLIQHAKEQHPAKR